MRWLTFTTVLLVAVLLPPTASAAKFSTPDLTVPTDGRAVLDKLVAAAELQDWVALRSLMAEEFKYSFGADRDSADDAISDWKQDPQVLLELVHVIKLGCIQALPPDRRIYCSGKGDMNYRGALARQADGTWKLIWFIAGD